MKRKMNGWKIATIVLAVFLFFSLFVTGVMTAVSWGFNLQIAELQSQNATLNDQIENPETGYKKQIADLTNQIENPETGYKRQLADLKAQGVLRNPTSEELTALLARDEIHKIPYSYPEFTGWDFAQAFRENAQKEGFRCGIVFLGYRSDIHTNINVFDIPAKGLVYVEPQSAQIVTVKVGERYFVPNGWPQPPYDDTIIHIGEPAW
jgi:cell division protein FtsB